MLNRHRALSHVTFGLLTASIILALAEPAWAQLPDRKLSAFFGHAGDSFGVSVSLSGDRALMGAPYRDDLGTDSGSAYIYEPQGDGSWLEVAKLTASDGAAEDYFGSSVSLSGNRALVGASDHDSPDTNSGLAYMYERQGDGSWLEVDKLAASDGEDYFGVSVSLSGDRALVGAIGVAYVFERQGNGSWLEADKLTASDGDEFDYFGKSVSLSGDRALVGALGHVEENVPSGSAYVYERQGDGSWIEVAELTASDGAAEDYFGESVSLSGVYTLIGAPGDDDLGRNSGSAYMFERQGDGSWIEIDKLTAFDAATVDLFATAVSLAGTRALVGVRHDDDLGTNSGSAYVFERQGDGSWLEIDKLTAFDGAAEDSFGFSVSLSGTRALVGAPGDNDSKGSAYVY